MEEEDLGVGDGCGEQTRGAAASGLMMLTLSIGLQKIASK
jgi:hypothetical protein